MTPNEPEHAALPHWRTAQASMAEARAIDPALAPAAAIHVAYYAMFHAARAVLVLRDGVEAAKTHRGVIGRFAQLAGDEAPGRDAARALNRAADARMAGDYAIELRPGPEQARLARERAEAFLGYVAGRFGFPA